MRIGVIGVGAHATNILYPNLAAAGMQIVAICAQHQDRATAAAATWGAEHAFDNAEEMLATTELDGVIVCVKPPDYADLITLCLNAGKPVFCEKPAAATAAEAEELADLSRSTGLPIVVGYMKRFAPAYRRAREIVRSSAFGPLSLGTFTFAMGQTQAYEDLRTYVIDNPVHHLDLARFYLGELTDLHAELTELPGFGFAIAATARATSGAVCTFNFCTTASWEQRNEYAEIYGKGHAVWINNVDTLTYRPPEPPEQTWDPNYTMPGQQNMAGYLAELEHFRHVVIDGAKNLSGMASASATLALAEQLYEVVQRQR